jgi:hypothetical protein
MLPPDEVRNRFEGSFSIEVLEDRQEGFPGTLTLYLMTRT